MQNFTDKTENYEKESVYIAIKEFFDSFFVERNYEKMLLMLADDFSGIGTVEDKIVTDKREFVLSLKTELSAMSGAVTYKIKSVSGEEIAKDVWNVMGTLEIEVVAGFEQSVKHYMHMTGCLKKAKDSFK